MGRQLLEKREGRQQHVEYYTTVYYVQHSSDVGFAGFVFGKLAKAKGIYHELFLVFAGHVSPDCLEVAACTNLVTSSGATGQRKARGYESVRGFTKKSREEHP